MEVRERTLFTSLISKTFSGMDAVLELPDLPHDISLYTWQLPNQSSYEWINYEALFDLNRKQPLKVLHCG
jgi:hypothetical protein